MVAIQIAITTTTQIRLVMRLLSGYRTARYLERSRRGNECDFNIERKECYKLCDFWPERCDKNMQLVFDMLFSLIAQNDNDNNHINDNIHFIYSWLSRTQTSKYQQLIKTKTKLQKFRNTICKFCNCNLSPSKSLPKIETVFGCFLSNHDYYFEVCYT